MKQPELGKKISELRKSRGLTQEELVDRCNISVRTIQRIETGEVSPRSYTIRTILDALDYDLSVIGSDKSEPKKFTSFLKELLLINVDNKRPSSYFIRQLNIAWIAGLFYFILGFLEVLTDYSIYTEGELLINRWLYVVIKIAVIVSFFYFQRGFILIGGLFESFLLKVIAFIMFFSSAFMIMYEIAAVFYDAIEREFMMGGFALTFGCVGIIHGIALIRLKKVSGDVAVLAGLAEIVAGGFFITIILSLLGVLFLVPAELLQIIVIYKVVEIIKKKQQEMEPLNQGSYS